MIDSRNNSQLFRAVTAMRDDSDYMQWFTDGKKWYQSIYLDATTYLSHKWHKATLEELINHFSLNPDKSNSNL